MTARIQTMSPVPRQPFAVLGESRLRAVESTKNRQNGTHASSLKRCFDAANLSDSENLDPLSGESPTKKSKDQVGSDTLTPKSRFHTLTTSVDLDIPDKSLVSTQILPRALTTSTPRPTPLRAAAGCSARSRVPKAFARRSSGLRRVEPPSRLQRQASRAPFSISNALSRTFSLSSFNPDGKITPNGGESRRKAWDFEIYVDSEQDEMANLMEHSTCVLDISDDEHKAEKYGLGKENIPPPDFSPETSSAGTQSRVAPTSEIVEMTDRPRSPLGELNPKEFIPEGEDSSAVIVVEVGEDDESETSSRHPSSSVPEIPVAHKISQTSEQLLLKQAVISSFKKNTAAATSDDEAEHCVKESTPSAAKAEIANATESAAKNNSQLNDSGTTEVSSAS
ncbi:hypothetical protein D8B26_006293 [Coccidioides posadasii str. Silveira]|uniref:Uncharacterized protein n=1 Tax=Coccidioides posadasii (strain RMSCC 757 / Silveira) TaxID=443226 RepID=E9CSP6_COCPS|nr:conserved hypothetical protein [Coccidioides posadasii str. Silveira]QVM11649.1 hypothetical protein D8B26_006293 [Coccidioides posadasii str. Silveira]